MSIEAISGLGQSFPLTSENPLAAGAQLGPGATHPLSGIEEPSALRGPEGVAPPGGFQDILQGALRSAAESGHEASAKADALAKGAIDDIHGTMISAKEAEISLKLVGAIRNKLLDAFHELWRTNV